MNYLDRSARPFQTSIPQNVDPLFFQTLPILRKHATTRTHGNRTLSPFLPEPLLHMPQMSTMTTSQTHGDQPAVPTVTHTAERVHVSAATARQHRFTLPLSRIRHTTNTILLLSTSLRHWRIGRRSGRHKGNVTLDRRKKRGRKMRRCRKKWRNGRKAIQIGFRGRLEAYFRTIRNIAGQIEPLAQLAQLAQSFKKLLSCRQFFQTLQTTLHPA